MNQEVNQKLKILMQGLYYPAVLGTGLVLLISKFTIYKSFGDAATDVSIYFGLLILIFFSVSFLISDTVEIRNYGPLAFLSDFTEILLIFFIFYFLGFFDPLNPDKIHLRVFYFLLAPIPLLEQVWNYAVSAKKYLFLSVTAAVILVIGGLLGFRYPPFNVSMIFVIAGLIGTYFLKLLK